MYCPVVIRAASSHESRVGRQPMFPKSITHKSVSLCFHFHCDECFSYGFAFLLLPFRAMKGNLGSILVIKRVWRRPQSGNCFPRAPGAETLVSVRRLSTGARRRPHSGILVALVGSSAPLLTGAISLVTKREACAPRARNNPQRGRGWQQVNHQVVATITDLHRSGQCLACR